MDPNDKIGPGGFGPVGFIASDAVLPYRIDFENDPTAPVPAQRVVITDQLDANLDLSSFSLTEAGFGDTLIAIPAGSQHFQTAVPMTFGGQTFEVQIELGLHSDTRQVYASFQSIDPSTSLPPDVFTGFLPPEDGTGRGLGYFSYTVRLNPYLPTGTQIRNVASVIFDVNLPIATNQVDEHDASKGTDPAKEAHNTIDAAPPTSSVTSLPALENAKFIVRWSGTDDTGGAGIGSFDVFASDNGGPYTAWQSSTTLTSAVFTGLPGHTYRFYAQATDNVGHVQAAAALPDAVTEIGSHLWHNVLNSLDVTGKDGEPDGLIVPGDALAIINYINAFGAGHIPANAASGPPYLDTAGGPSDNGDDFVVPGDALAVINFINAAGNGLPGPSGEGEGIARNPLSNNSFRASISSSASSQPAPPAWPPSAFVDAVYREVTNNPVIWLTSAQEFRGSTPSPAANKRAIPDLSHQHDSSSDDSTLNAAVDAIFGGLDSKRSKPDAFIRSLARVVSR